MDWRETKSHADRAARRQAILFWLFLIVAILISSGMALRVRAAFNYQVYLIQSPEVLLLDSMQQLADSILVDAKRVRQGVERPL